MLKIGGFEMALVAIFAAATAHAYPFNTGTFFRDTEAPAVLDGFSAATGTNPGEIAVTVNFPVAPAMNDYGTAVIRRIGGAVAPNAACTDGTPAKTYNIGSFNDEVYTDAGLTAGSFYSYRACIYDASANLTSTQTAVNVKAKTATHISVCRYIWTTNCTAYCSGLGMACISQGIDAGATNNGTATSNTCATNNGFATCGASSMSYARCKCE